MKYNEGAHHKSHLVQGFHVFQLISQLNKCWSRIWVILPAARHDLVPEIDISVLIPPFYGA